MSIRVCSTLMLLLCLGCESERPRPAPTPPVRVSATPSDDDLVRAVRSHLSGKAYVEQGWTFETRRRTCSQVQVDMDIHAKHNPELARCPYVGASYEDRVRVPTTTRKPCPSPPGPGPHWLVSKAGSSTWRVSTGGRVWEVTKVTGGSASAKDVVTVGAWQFTIRAHQEC